MSDAPASLDNARSYHFVGIGGVGMSAVAQVCAARGCRVTGSDRSHDAGQRARFFEALNGQGLSIFPQDGSGLDAAPDLVVVSTAIEHDNPDLSVARDRHVPVVHRAEVLAHLVHRGQGIAVTGTSGKTTVTAMVGWMLEQAGRFPTIVNGGPMKNFAALHPPGNAVAGRRALVCAEADESDGTLERFAPHVGVVTNVSRDHKEVEELLATFRSFVSRVKHVAVLNADSPECLRLAAECDRAVTYGSSENADVRVTAVRPVAMGAAFDVRGHPFEIHMPGDHNVSNAAAAIAVGLALGLSLEQIDEALWSFTGVSRRLEVVAQVGDVCIIDDYAHNPQKIAASLSALRPYCDKLVAVFQPHGFGPTQFMRDELIDVFASHIGPRDVLFIPDIYYAGGTANACISSVDIVDALVHLGIDARYVRDREQAVHDIVAQACGRTMIPVMGARDDTLTDFCEDLATAARGVQPN